MLFTKQLHDMQMKSAQPFSILPLCRPCTNVRLVPSTGVISSLSTWVRCWSTLSSGRGPRYTARATTSTSWRSTVMRSSTQQRKATRRASSTTAATQTVRHKRLEQVFVLPRSGYSKEGNALHQPQLRPKLRDTRTSFFSTSPFGHAGEIIRLCVTAY